MEIQYSVKINNKKVIDNTASFQNHSTKLEKSEQCSQYSDSIKINTNQDSSINSIQFSKILQDSIINSPNNKYSSNNNNQSNSIYFSQNSFPKNNKNNKQGKGGRSLSPKIPSNLQQTYQYHQDTYKNKSKQQSQSEKQKYAFQKSLGSDYHKYKIQIDSTTDKILNYQVGDSKNSKLPRILNKQELYPKINAKKRERAFTENHYQSTRFPTLNYKSNQQEEEIYEKGENKIFLEKNQKPKLPFQEFFISSFIDTLEKIKVIPYYYLENDRNYSENSLQIPLKTYTFCFCQINFSCKGTYLPLKIYINLHDNTDNNNINNNNPKQQKDFQKKGENRLHMFVSLEKEKPSWSQFDYYFENFSDTLTIAADSRDQKKKPPEFQHIFITFFAEKQLDFSFRYKDKFGFKENYQLKQIKTVQIKKKKEYKNPEILEKRAQELWKKYQPMVQSKESEPPNQKLQINKVQFNKEEAKYYHISKLLQQVENQQKRVESKRKVDFQRCLLKKQYQDSVKISVIKKEERQREFKNKKRLDYEREICSDQFKKAWVSILLTSCLASYFNDKIIGYKITFLLIIRIKRALNKMVSKFKKRQALLPGSYEKKRLIDIRLGIEFIASQFYKSSKKKAQHRCKIFGENIIQVNRLYLKQIIYMRKIITIQTAIKIQQKRKRNVKKILSKCWNFCLKELLEDEFHFKKKGFITTSHIQYFLEPLRQQKPKIIEQIYNQNLKIFKQKLTVYNEYQNLLHYKKQLQLNIFSAFQEQYNIKYRNHILNEIQEHYIPNSEHKKLHKQESKDLFPLFKLFYLNKQELIGLRKNYTEENLTYDPQTLITPYGSQQHLVTELCQDEYLDVLRKEALVESQKQSQYVSNIIPPLQLKSKKPVQKRFGKVINDKKSLKNLNFLGIQNNKNKNKSNNNTTTNNNNSKTIVEAQNQQQQQQQKRIVVQNTIRQRSPKKKETITFVGWIKEEIEKKEVVNSSIDLQQGQDKISKIIKEHLPTLNRKKSEEQQKNQSNNAGAIQNKKKNLLRNMKKWKNVDNYWLYKKQKEAILQKQAKEQNNKNQNEKENQEQQKEEEKNQEKENEDEKDTNNTGKKSSKTLQKSSNKNLNILSSQILKLVQSNNSLEEDEEKDKEKEKEKKKIRKIQAMDSYLWKPIKILVPSFLEMKEHILVCLNSFVLAQETRHSQIGPKDEQKQGMSEVGDNNKSSESSSENSLSESNLSLDEMLQKTKNRQKQLKKSNNNSNSSNSDSDLSNSNSLNSD